MARPKLDKPRKQNLTLTVDKNVRDMLAEVSQYYGRSISDLVSEFAREEMEAIKLYKESRSSDYVLR